MTKKKIIAAGVLILGIVLVAIVFFLELKRHRVPNESLPSSHIMTTVDGQQIKVRIADTEKEREDGLSGFPSLPDDQGMLFIFPTAGNYPFWMKDMSFPLDIIWLKSTNAQTFQVVGVKADFTPDSYPAEYAPKGDADAVLEINSGDAARWGIVNGSNQILTYY